MKDKAKRLAVEFYREVTQNARTIDEIPYVGQEAVRNMFAGFLQACERLELISHDEAQTMFQNLQDGTYESN